MASDNEYPWEGRYCDITHEFAKQCAELKESNPYPNWRPNYGTTLHW